MRVPSRAGPRADPVRRCSPPRETLARPAPYRPRNVSDATTREISFRTFSSSSGLIPGLILSRSIPGARISRTALPAVRSRTPGNPRRQQLRILVDELGQVVTQSNFAGVCTSHQAAVLGPKDVVPHRFECQVDLRHAQPL